MLALLCLPAALAFSSETQDVHFEDLADVFQGAEFSTGWVPGGSPIAVQFAIESNGGADVAMDGTADLSWPSPFRLDYTPEPESGSLLLDASIDAVTSIQIDLSDWGYYGTFELDRRSLPVHAETTFDPFKLDGSVDQRVEVVDEGNPNELIYYSYEIIAGLSLDFSATIRTRSVVGFQGVSITTGDQVLTQEGEAAALPAAGEASYLVDSTFRGAWDTTVDLVLTPEAEACSAFGCVTLLSFDIPFTLLSDAFEQDFPQAQQVFPLPLQVVDTTDRDLGDVTVGGVGNLDVPIENEGDLPLTGTARIEGSADFSVYPATYAALPGATDGLVVTFLPSVDGPQQAWLILDSNDPNVPSATILLSANGAATDVGYDTGDETIEKPLAGCGCASAPATGTTGLGALALGIVGLLAARRRG